MSNQQFFSSVYWVVFPFKETHYRINEFVFFNAMTSLIKCTVNWKEPFWPQKWGQNFDPETVPL